MTCACINYGCGRLKRIVVVKESSKEELFSFLKKDEIWAGYAICDLEGDMFPKCDWYVAKLNGDIISLCLHFKGLDTTTLISIGESSGVAKIVEMTNEETLRFQMPLEHRDIIGKHYGFDNLSLMSRMVVSQETFRPVEGSAIRMNEEDLPDLERFYSSRQDAFFRPYMLSSGVYYGARENGELVSAAGTHVVSPTYGVACVGNVFTNPLYRRKGHASVCTGEVVRELLTSCSNVILNVNRKNLAAIRLYERLGFREHCKYLEGLGRLQQ